MKKIIAFVLSLCMVASLAACSGGSSSSGTTASQNADTTAAEETTKSAEQEVIDEAKANVDNVIITDAVISDYQADKITIVTNNNAATLYPWGLIVSYTPMFEIYESLFAYEEYGGDMKPLLADRNRGEFGGYDHEEGTGDYTVYIYDYIYDHAGNHITANDVKFSYDTAVELEAPGDQPWDVFEGTDVIDDTTIVFHFSRELDQLDDFTGFWPKTFIISEQAFNDSLGNSADKKSALVSDACGTGPYKLTSYIAGSGCTLEAWDDYWQKDDSLKIQCQFQNVKVIDVPTITESSQQLLSLETGTVDIVTDCPTDNLGTFLGEGKTGYNLYSFTQSGQRYVAPNCSESSIMNDINMRLAVFYAIDVAGIITMMGGEESNKQCYTIFGAEVPEANPEWKNWENYQTVTDLDLSKEYADKAGYNGETIKFIAGKKESQMATIVTNQLTAAGFNIDLNVLDDASFKTAQGEQDGWDLCTGKGQGWCGAVGVNQAWNKNLKTGMTKTFIDDQEWFDMLATILTNDGHTQENIDAYAQHAIDNAYAIGVYSQVNNYVFNSNLIQAVTKNGKNVIIPGGFIYVDPSK